MTTASYAGVPFAAFSRETSCICTYSRPSIQLKVTSCVVGRRAIVPRSTHWPTRRSNNESGCSDCAGAGGAPATRTSSATSVRRTCEGIEVHSRLSVRRKLATVALYVERDRRISSGTYRCDSRRHSLRRALDANARPLNDHGFLLGEADVLWSGVATVVGAHGERDLPWCGRPVLLGHRHLDSRTVDALRMHHDVAAKHDD